MNFILTLLRCLMSIIFIASTLRVAGQETVFSLMKSNIRLADDYYNQKNYKAALDLYVRTARTRTITSLPAKIGRCQFALKNYEGAVASFEKYSVSSLSLPDLFLYAESLSALKNYSRAIEVYRAYLKHSPNDEIMTQKVWRLSNVKYLYDDSIHFAVRPVGLNTSDGELCPVPFRNGLAFLSNRKEVRAIEKVDAASGKPFYKLYFARQRPDSAFRAPFPFDIGAPDFHSGPVAFYSNDTRMVLTTTSKELSRNGFRTLRLQFAEWRGGRWEITHDFPFNSKEYTITDPSINNAGTVLYFSSDMRGGFGGRDLYRSEYIDDRWTTPVNLGSTINTRYDEAFPYLHLQNTLYFSSNGHAGMGGLDIFRSAVASEGYGEPEQMGYPVNSNLDDFGIVVDSVATHAFFSSNRKNGGYNDDLYEVDLDMQTYPLVIDGYLRMKEESWADTTQLMNVGKASLYLIDNLRNVVVSQCFSDEQGNFSITVPKFSVYKIRVIDQDEHEHVVSLEIPKNRKRNARHEIVIVKDAFRSKNND